MKLLCKTQLPIEWTCQVSVFTYNTLDAALNAILAQQYHFSGGNQVLFFLVCAWACLSTSTQLRRHRCPHRHTAFMYVISEEPKLLWEQNSLNFVLNSHSSGALSVGFLSVYSIPVGYSCANPWQVPPLCIVAAIASYFMSLSGRETGAQCKITVTKTLDKRKKHHKKSQAAACLCNFLFADSLASPKEMRCIHTEKKQAPSARPGPLGFCWWGCWYSWLGLWRKTGGTFLPYLPPGQAQLSPLWVVFPVMEVLSFRSWCDPGVNWAH